MKRRTFFGGLLAAVGALIARPTGASVKRPRTAEEELVALTAAYREKRVSFVLRWKQLPRTFLDSWQISIFKESKVFPPELVLCSYAATLPEALEQLESFIFVQTQ